MNKSVIILHPGGSMEPLIAPLGLSKERPTVKDRYREEGTEIPAPDFHLLAGCRLSVLPAELLDCCSPLKRAACQPRQVESVGSQIC